MKTGEKDDRFAAEQLNKSRGLQYRIKKLALAYKTGWEYLPGDKEPGSVMTDLFLGMLEENRNRYARIWEKHGAEFLSAVPELEERERLLKGAVTVKASEESNGKWLLQGSQAYMVPEDGSPMRFLLNSSLQLTSADLKYAVYQKGLYAWLVYGGENNGKVNGKAAGEMRIPWFVSMGQELQHPVFRWRFPGLCNGLKKFRFFVDNVIGSDDKLGNMEKTVMEEIQRCGGLWRIESEGYCYALEWEQTSEGVALYGDTPGFAASLEEQEYEICLEIPCQERQRMLYSQTPFGELPSAEMFSGEIGEILSKGFCLREPEAEGGTILCVTDEGAGDGSRVLPFGNAPDDSSCLYLSCDRVFARERGEIILEFTESFVTEEKLPPDKPEGYEKIYKKYPWLKQVETIYDWKPEETVWEYFNGKNWRTLPGSMEWRTGCVAGENPGGVRRFAWQRPEDMQPCTLEGELHFYIRLRLVRAVNAYAAFYRKYIPVLEQIRFTTRENIWECTKWEIPDLSEADSVKMYFGFDRAVTAENCWYMEYEGKDKTGSGSFSFAEKQMDGQGNRFGLDAFWVELTPEEAGSTLGIPAEAERLSFRANYAEVLQLAVKPPRGGESEQKQEPEHEQEPGTGIKCDYGEKGTVFYIETKEMGVLEAVTVADAYYEGAGAPCQGGRKMTENFFQRYDRLVTPMDIETLMKERYPAMQVLSCSFSGETGEVTIRVVPMQKQATAERAKAELTESRLLEMQEFLEETLHFSGSLWLQECRVNMELTSAP